MRGLNIYKQKVFTLIVLFNCIVIIINDQYMFSINIHAIRKYHILNYCNSLNFTDSFDSFSVKKYHENSSLNYSVIIFHISWFWKSKGTSWTVIKLRQATLMANLWVTHIRYSMVGMRDHILEQEEVFRKLLSSQGHDFNIKTSHRFLLLNYLLNCRMFQLLF